jgi:hypothetical protein
VTGFAPTTLTQFDAGVAPTLTVDEGAAMKLWIVVSRQDRTETHPGAGS